MMVELLSERGRPPNVAVQLYLTSTCRVVVLEAKLDPPLQVTVGVTLTSEKGAVVLMLAPGVRLNVTP